MKQGQSGALLPLLSLCLGTRPPWHWGPWGTAAGAEGHSVTRGKEMSEAAEDPHLCIESLINTVL